MNDNSDLSSELAAMTVPKLKNKAKKYGIKIPSRMKKEEIVDTIMKFKSSNNKLF